MQTRVAAEAFIVGDNLETLKPSTTAISLQSEPVSDHRAYYAVKYGRVPGIYSSWRDCQKQTSNFTKPVYKKFTVRLFVRTILLGRVSSQTLAEAKEWMSADDTTHKRKADNALPDDKDKPKAKRSKYGGKCLEYDDAMLKSDVPIVFTGAV